MSYADLALLVSSCDRYAACWAPFCHGLEKYWPGHPPLHFITNRLSAPAGESIRVGADRGWACNLKTALEQVGTEFILYAQEDYWIQSPVGSGAVGDYLEFLRSGLADYIRLYPAPPPDLPFPGDRRLGVIAPDAPYRTSLQMALWRRAALLELLDPAESPWQFEVKSPARTVQSDGSYLCVSKKQHGIDYIFTAVVGGYWSKQAHEYARRENIPVDWNSLPKRPFHRRLMILLKTFAYKIKKAAGN